MANLKTRVSWVNLHTAPLVPLAQCAFLLWLEELMVDQSEKTVDMYYSGEVQSENRTFRLAYHGTRDNMESSDYSDTR